MRTTGTDANKGDKSRKVLHAIWVKKTHSVLTIDAVVAVRYEIYISNINELRD